MAFRATLKLGGKEFDVLDCNYRFNRDVDSKGQPSSNIYGGKIYVSVESTEDTTILSNMINQFNPINGSIIFKKGDEEAKMKELVWEKGYIIEFDEAIEVTGPVPMTIRFIVSAQTVKVGDVSFEQNWPK